MQRLDGQFVYSASDLNDYLECRRLTELESLVARGALLRPDNDDEQAQLLRLKGEAHEAAHLERLRELYRDDVVEFGRSENSIEGYRRAEAETLDAMRRGVAVIYQATFFDGTFIGRGDFLRRVAVASELGDYSYEVVDTKLGLNPKPYYIIQLCNYSEHVQRLQGQLPREAHVLLGNGAEQSFRLNDYMAYYRRLKRRFMEFAAASETAGGPEIYPLKCSHCKLCAWNQECESRRRGDDHLSLVARIR
ncbi:MAG: TM0106 family RecB-like putative nuclease, partial [Candidatus Eremiobacteraeota bacterium]|nr:TM0106 family RecB-like putative nuclease [Candidatus Eremiobacteraeota bacterium]